MRYIVLDFFSKKMPLYCIKFVFKIDNIVLNSFHSVDGGYGEWSAWSDCTQTCDGGQKHRYRDCNSPRPLGKGKVCDSDEGFHFKFCNEFSCNGKSNHFYTHKMVCLVE